MMERAELFDPELIARLASRDLPGPPSPHPQRGVHRSPRRGASLEFSEHTEYSPGDDLRHLDWKVFAKRDRPFIKRYEDERLQRAVLVLDASASMGYGGGAADLRGSKLQFAARLVVALAACLVRQGDAVGLQVAGGEERLFLPPRGGSAQLQAIVETLCGVRPSGEAQLDGTCRNLGERLGRAAAVFLVSDFREPEQEELAGARALAARGVAVRLVQVLHAEELDLPFDNTTRFLDLEGPGDLTLDPVPLRRAYAEEIRAFVQALARSAERAGLPYAFTSTGADPAPALVRLVRRMGRG